MDITKNIVVGLCLLMLATIVEIVAVVLFIFEPHVTKQRWTTKNTLFHAMFEYFGDQKSAIPMAGNHVHDDVPLTASDASRFADNSF